MSSFFSKILSFAFGSKKVEALPAPASEISPKMARVITRTASRVKKGALAQARQAAKKAGEKKAKNEIPKIEKTIKKRTPTKKVPKGGDNKKIKNENHDNTASDSNVDHSAYAVVNGDGNNVSSKKEVNSTTQKKQKDTNKPCVMISFNVRTMLKEATQLRSIFLRNGINPFICTQSILLGQDFRKAINKTARNCDYFICLVNSAWIESGECQFEYNIALSATIRDTTTIIPLILKYDLKPELQDDPAALGFLSNYHSKYVRAPEDLEIALEELVAQIVVGQMQKEALQKKAEEEEKKD